MSKCLVVADITDDVTRVEFPCELHCRAVEPENRNQTIVSHPAVIQETKGEGEEWGWVMGQMGRCVSGGVGGQDFTCLRRTPERTRTRVQTVRGQRS